MAAVTVSQGALDVRTVQRQAIAGQPVYSNEQDTIVSLVNKNPQAAQVSTITVDTGTNSYLYSITINGVAVTYTADSSTSTTEVAVGLTLAINASPVVRGAVAATSLAAVVTVTGQYAGQSFTITDTSAVSKCTIATTTSAAAAATVAFGAAIQKASWSTTEASEYGYLMATAGFSAQVITISPVYASSEVYYIAVVIAGVTYGPVAVTASTNTATDCTAIAAAINAIMPANTVIASGASTTTVTFTAEIVGTEFDVTVGLATGTTAHCPPAVYTTGPSIATSAKRAFAGVALYAAEEVTTVGGNTSNYPANAGMKVLSKGQVWVANTQTIAEGDDVYVELGSGGGFFNTAGTTRVRLDRSVAQWVRSGLVSADGLAALSISIRP